ncbi:hypothetical protein [Allosalinactinospora lopnorensis]|uniref:hypothetical protein n=1 Tax=Allosalinactinospora lopnorensis TaxID=1352348 RepID=UPI000623F595|nr:hypothetical protein [Allosalinactinospora lopnorensis]
MTDLWGLLLVALGGMLAGGAIAMWKFSRAAAALLAVCAALAVASGVLRLDYF